MSVLATTDQLTRITSVPPQVIEFPSAAHCIDNIQHESTTSSYSTDLFDDDDNDDNKDKDADHESITLTGNIQHERTSSVTTPELAPQQFKPKRKKAASKKQDDQDMQQLILSTLEKTTSQFAQQDEHDHFGMFIASSLRRMNPVKADLAKLEIVKVMTQAQCDVQIKLIYGSSGTPGSDE